MSRVALGLAPPHIDLIGNLFPMLRPSSDGNQTMETGVMLDGRKTKPTKVEILRQSEKSAWLKIELHEGRNRQIRRMCELVNLAVKYLKRTHFGVFELKKLQIGKFRIASPNQVKAMLNKLES